MTWPCGLVANSVCILLCPCYITTAFKCHDTKFGIYDTMLVDDEFVKSEIVGDNNGYISNSFRLPGLPTTLLDEICVSLVAWEVWYQGISIDHV